jgi:hypothetical protein
MVACRPVAKLAAFALAAIGFVAALWLLWPRSAINRDNFARLHVGMRLAEAERVLGGPERDESTGQLLAELDEVIADAFERALAERSRVDLFYRAQWGGQRDLERSKCWVSDTVMIRVDHDDDDRVTRVQAPPVRCVRERPLAWLRRQLGLSE